MGSKTSNKSVAFLSFKIILKRPLKAVTHIKPNGKHHLK